MKKIIIVGSSGHSKVIIDIIEKENKFQIIGCIDNNSEYKGDVLGYKVIGNDSDLSKILVNNPEHAIFVAIGDNWIRKKIVEKILKTNPDTNFASVIHPSAIIGKNCKIGKGVAIMAGTIINCNTIIEDFTIINTKVSIDHDCKIMKFSSLAPNVTTGGNITIGEFSSISIGSIIKHGVTIGNHTVIGAGSLLINSCGDQVVLYGTPAKEIRKRKIGESYL